MMPSILGDEGALHLHLLAERLGDVDVEAHELAVGGEVVERRVGGLQCRSSTSFPEPGRRQASAARPMRQAPYALQIRMIVLSLLSRPSFQTALWAVLLTARWLDTPTLSRKKQLQNHCLRDSNSERMVTQR